MALQTYPARVIVVRKTKLGESDLIVTMLSRDGSQLRAVAKGARKPTSPFSSRLELLSEADVLLARGRSLDIVKEARLVDGFSRVRGQVELSVAGAPIAEALERITQQNLESPRLFDMTHAALFALDASDALHAPAICAAHLLKTFAFAGIRPSLDACCLCGGQVAGEQGRAGAARVAFSYTEGGAECAACRTPDALLVPAEALAWSRALLGMRFSDIGGLEIDQSAVFGVLRLAQGWARVHASASLRSLDFLFTCGLF